MTAYLSLRALEKRFPNGTVALDRIDLDVAEGELVALLGPSGCGKTTTLRCIPGFEDPPAGSIDVAGKRTALVPPDPPAPDMGYPGYDLLPPPPALSHAAGAHSRPHAPAPPSTTAAAAHPGPPHPPVPATPAAHQPRQHPRPVWAWAQTPPHPMRSH